MRKNIKYFTGFLALFIGVMVQPALAAGPKAPSLFSNPIAILLLSLMLVCLIVIGILGNIIVGAAAVNRKRKKNMEKIATGTLTTVLLLLAPSLLAQTNDTGTTVKTAATIPGLDSSAFYLMISILFFELLVILVLLINIRLLLKKERLALEPEVSEAAAKEAKANRLSWWDRFNKLKPVSQEAELDLGHEYDGIRELNNRLPPWWLYGFYITILFAAIYLWRFHVSHTGPSSKEEYEISVARAEQKVKEYLKAKGEAVDENTVTLLTAREDIEAGKAIYSDPAKCVTCHGRDAGGNAIGPNLVDAYWLYGGNIRDVFKTIKYGTNKGMRSWKDDLSPRQIAQVASYLKSIQGTKPANPKEPQGALYIEESAGPPKGDSVTKMIGKL